MSADYIVFDEGAQYLDTHGNGLPATCYFLLSTKAINALLGSNTLAGGVGEIAGSGYSRPSQPAPTPVGPLVSFAQMRWDTKVAADWPANVHSLVLATTPDNTGKAICAWNIIPCLVPSPLSPVSIASSGGSGAAGVYYWSRTVVNQYGESTGVTYSAYVPAGGTVTFNWAAVPGATGNGLYRATSSAGVYTSPAKVPGVGTGLTFTDTMAATVAGSCPNVNATQGYLDMAHEGYSLLAAPTLTLGD